MILIIDGYNVIKQVFHKVKGKLEVQRQQLIKELAYYKKKKIKTIKNLILVFDGGFIGHADRQVHDGVVVVFSGNKESADDWIINFAQKHKNQEMLLVTKDKKLLSECKKYGVDGIDVYDFYDIVQNSILEDIEKELKLRNNSDLLKQDDSSLFEEHLHGFEAGNNETLDILMAQVDVADLNKDKFNFDRKIEKMNKEDKRIYKKIKKL